MDMSHRPARHLRGRCRYALARRNPANISRKIRRHPPL